MAAKPQRQYLVGTLNTRGIVPVPSSFDQYYQNVLFVPIKNELKNSMTVYVEKRFGYATGAAMSNFNSILNTYWWAAGSSGAGVVVNSGDSGGVTAVGLGNTIIKSHATLEEAKYFSDTTNSAGTAFLSWSTPSLSSPTGTEIWGYPDAGATAQITVNSQPVGRLEHMDGWSLMGNASPARIYNSNLNDPTTGYTNYAPCDTEPDKLQTVVKYGRYILGMGKNTIEWFYNAGNPSGSPLSRIQDAGIQAKYAKIGLYGNTGEEASCVCIGGGSVWFISQGADCGISLHRINGTELTKISHPIVERLFTQAGNERRVKYIEWAGVPLVMVDFGVSVGAWVYFPQVNLWSFWTSVSVNLNVLVNDSAVEQGSSLRAYSKTGSVLIAQASATTAVYQDNGTDISRIIRTATNDFGSSNHKQERFFRIIGDKASSTQYIGVRTTDDDYVNYSPKRNVNMALDKPELQRGGRFVRRAYELSDTTNAAGRIVAIEPWIEEEAT